MNSLPNFFLICWIALCNLLSFWASGADRVALVIGVDQYQHLPQHSQLNVAVKDAQLMAETLKSLDPPFSVTLLTNAAQRDTMETLTAFVDEADGTECALVYFAGHGIEYHGSNYLLSSDTKVDRVSPDVDRMKRRLGLTSIPLQAIVDELDGTGAQVKVVILDACRDNPLKVLAGGTRSVFGSTRGLASVTAPSGTLISFSADAGQQANDGLFTKVLTKYLKQPGLALPHVFALTREEVKIEAIELQETKRGVFHEPAEYTKLNFAGMKFSFVPKASQRNGVDSAEVLAMRKKIEQLEREKMAAVASEWKTRGFTNSLGMKFLPVQGTNVLFCEHETRVRDYAAFANENPDMDMDWKGVTLDGHPQDSDHPVVNVDWSEAKAFCLWLSRKEGKRYRLPTDHEWSVAIGIGSMENHRKSPEEKEGDVKGYPWGNQWPPPPATGNFAGSESVFFDGRAAYHDSHPFTAPVRSYRVGANGLYDMSGNVWEWCEDWLNSDREQHVIRGGSWFNMGWGEGDDYLSSGNRSFWQRGPMFTKKGIGFRCVVETGN